MRTTELTAQHPPLAGAPWEDVTVGEVMHPGVIVCSPESPVRHAAWLMATHRIHAVVVLADDEGGGLWGVITDADVLAAAARDELDGVTAGAIAQTPIATVCRSDSLVRARERMHEHRVTHLLVTVRDQPVGIISTLDLVSAAAAGVGTPRRQSAAMAAS
jgi:CBS domain-containing protein